MNNISKSLPSVKIESGIYTADRIKDSMLHSFHNGKVRGVSTNIKKLDPHFSWKKGEVTCITGWPQSGKSEFTMFLMLAMAVHSGWKWALYCPENMSVDHNDTTSAGEIFDTLIHMLIGKGVDPYYKNNQMTEQEYEAGIEFISKHFFVVYPEEDHKVDVINDYLLHITMKYKVDGWLKDPWNSLDDDYGQREDQFLRRYLSRENKLAKQKKICNVISAHPAGKPVKLDDGTLERPSQFNLSGGNMWNNKMDNVLSLNRPYYFQDMADTRVEIHSLKIKKQKLVGIPGMVSMDFIRQTNRYYVDGVSAIEGIFHGV
jgi:hypothetical protein